MDSSDFITTEYLTPRHYAIDSLRKRGTELDDCYKKKEGLAISGSFPNLEKFMLTCTWLWQDKSGYGVKYKKAILYRSELETRYAAARDLARLINDNINYDAMTHMQRVKLFIEIDHIDKYGCLSKYAPLVFDDKFEGVSIFSMDTRELDRAYSAPIADRNSFMFNEKN